MAKMSKKSSPTQARALKQHTKSVKAAVVRGKPNKKGKSIRGGAIE